LQAAPHAAAEQSCPSKTRMTALMLQLCASHCRPSHAPHSLSLPLPPPSTTPCRQQRGPARGSRIRPQPPGPAELGHPGHRSTGPGPPQGGCGGSAAQGCCSAVAQAAGADHALCEQRAAEARHRRLLPAEVDGGAAGGGAGRRRCGQRAVGSGQWAVGSGQWAVCALLCAVCDVWVVWLCAMCHA
jgi:hypothetical protein